MDDFDDRARRAGQDLDQSVADLIPTAAPAPSKSTRRVGIVVALAAVITAAVVVIADHNRSDTQVLAQVPPTTTTVPAAASAIPHYLPRWLPDGFQRVSGAGVGFLCLPASDGDSTGVAATPAVTVPASAANNTNGCPTTSWTAIFIGTASTSIGPHTIALVGTNSAPLLLQGARVTVHGQPAVLANPVAAVPDHWTLSWAEPDLNLTITGTGVSRDDMLRVADSVERVDDTEWNQPAPPLLGSGPSAIAPPNFANGTEIARLTTTNGQLVRLLRLSDGLCIDAGNNRGCAGGPDPTNAPPQGTALLKLSSGTATDRYGAILLPPGLPTDLTLRRSSGETVQSTLSSDGRYLLFDDSNAPVFESDLRVVDYDIIDPTGQVLARVTTAPPFTCPSSVPTTIVNCVPATATSR